MARCTLEHYTAFLLAEAQNAGCVRLAEVSGGEFAHDATNRFLHREDFSPRDLFEEMRPLIVLEEGIPSVGDTRLDKPHIQEDKTDLVNYFWSGLHGKVLKGINLITLFYGEFDALHAPVSFLVVAEAEGKIKNRSLSQEKIVSVRPGGEPSETAVGEVPPAHDTRSEQQNFRGSAAAMNDARSQLSAIMLFAEIPDASGRELAVETVTPV